MCVASVCVSVHSGSTEAAGISLADLLATLATFLASGAYVNSLCATCLFPENNYFKKADSNFYPLSSNPLLLTKFHSHRTEAIPLVRVQQESARLCGAGGELQVGWDMSSAHALDAGKRAVNKGLC